MLLVIRTSLFIDAPRTSVWNALVRRDTVLAILPVTEVTLGWREGEAFLWTFDLGSRRSQVEGFVHRMEEDLLLDYEYADPRLQGVRQADSVRRVTIELTDDADGTRATVTERESSTLTAHAHAERDWRFALHNLKHVVELEQHLPARTRAR